MNNFEYSDLITIAFTTLGIYVNKSPRGESNLFYYSTDKQGTGEKEEGYGISISRRNRCLPQTFL